MKQGAGSGAAGVERQGNDLWLAYPSRKLNSPALMSYIDFAISLTR